MIEDHWHEIRLARYADGGDPWAKLLIMIGVRCYSVPAGDYVWILPAFRDWPAVELRGSVEDGAGPMGVVMGLHPVPRIRDKFPRRMADELRRRYRVLYNAALGLCRS